MPRMSSLVSWGLPGQGTATPPRSGRVTQSLLEAFIRAVSKDECLGKKKRSQDWARPRALWGVSPLPTTAKPPTNPGPGRHTHSRPRSSFSDRHKSLS